jgi:hypothetical protein
VRLTLKQTYFTTLRRHDDSVEHSWCLSGVLTADCGGGSLFRVGSCSTPIEIALIVHVSLYCEPLSLHVTI